jgi:hypothetical protein
MVEIQQFLNKNSMFYYFPCGSYYFFNISIHGTEKNEFLEALLLFLYHFYNHVKAQLHITFRLFTTFCQPE